MTHYPAADSDEPQRQSDNRSDPDSRVKLKENEASVMTVEMARQRAKMLAVMRQFFALRDVMEVQTPIMSQAGNTDVFISSVTSQITLYDQPHIYYLHTSPEFAMKRLLANWQVPIYQICSVFRDNEIGARHNIEFTMLEWYRPDWTLTQLAEELGELLSHVYGHPVILDHYSYCNAFVDYVGVHPLLTNIEELQRIATEHNLTVDLGDEHQGWLDLLFSHLVEPNLGRDIPTLVYDYPPATAALAKIDVNQDSLAVAKRFELYIDGVEIANAYDELADSDLLRQRFKEDNTERKQRGLPIIPIDEQLLVACNKMPECSGIALGVDRLLMVLTGATQINDVIAFGIETA